MSQLYLFIHNKMKQCTLIFFPHLIFLIKKPNDKKSLSKKDSLDLYFSSNAANVSM